MCSDKRNPLIQRLFSLCILVCSLSYLCSAGLAQSSEATLGGVVEDKSGAIVPNVQIKVTSTTTGITRAVTTNQSGAFSVPGLNPGTYSVHVDHSGFAAVDVSGITLNVADNRQLEIKLDVGATQQSVTVDAAGQTINTTDASVSTVVDRNFVENMPLNGRSFQSLITLTPGALTSPVSTDEEGQFSVAGQRAGANYFTVDGVGANFAASTGIFQSQSANGGLPAFSVLGSTTSLVSVDALQEFRLESSTYAPEFGRQSGGQVALVTRSGGNRFHGTAFDYFRNDALDANDWFADNLAVAKPRERQNDFGGVFGGPIRKDKTFFFFSYEGLRVAQPIVTLNDVPSLAARAAAPPNVKPFVDAFPLPNGPDTGVDMSQYASSGSTRSTVDATSIRIDQSLSSRFTLFGRFNYSPSSSTSPNPPSNPHSLAQNILTATVGSTMVVTPALTNDIRANYSRAHASLPASLDNTGGAIAPSFASQLASWQDAATSWVCFGSLTGRNSDVCDGMFADNLNRQFNITDTVALTKAGHSMKFGFDLRRLTPVQVPSSSGIFYFWETMSSFVSGVEPDDSVADQNPENIDLRFYNFSAFAQDTWKASNRLTLTYGLRWDFNPPPVVTSDNPPYTISQISDLSTAVLLPQGSPLWHARWANFAPRFGASYLLRPGDTRPTVLRVGVGQIYDLGTSSAGALSNAEGYFPYSLETNLCMFGTIASCTNAIPYAGPKPAFVFTQPYPEMRAFDPHLKLPYALEWNVALEQALSPDQTIKVTYLGSAGRSLLRDELINNPNPTLSFLLLTTNSSYANYDALQLQYQRHLSRGLQVLASYSWSHSLDLNSADVVTGWNATTTIPSSLYNVHQDYGNSDFDIRHSFSAALSYNVPQLKVQNFLARSVLRDWSIDSINTARTGSPFNVLYQPETASGGYVDQHGSAIELRPDQVPGQPVWMNNPRAPGGKQLNPAAFTIPSTITQGSERRNNIQGLPLVEIDMAVRRQFSLSEHVRLQFRADAFNIINHPNFGNPLVDMGICSLGTQCTPAYGWGVSQAMLNNSLGAQSSGGYVGGFASLYQAGGPRSLQLSMKLQF